MPPALRSRLPADLTLATATAVAFLLCFAPALATLVHAWWTAPELGHALLVAPIALWLAARTGVRPDRPRPLLGATLVAAGALAAVVGSISGSATLPRIGILAALAGLTIHRAGARQLLRWWLPAALLVLCMPIPSGVLARVTLPLQSHAAQLGAGLLGWRHVPVVVSGNIIQLPGHALFVSEACSGLRSLTALLSLGLLTGGTLLRHPTTRGLVLAATVALAVLINGVRVFLTGFLVFFVDPKLGEGFMHLTEGYLLFLVSLAVLFAITWAAARAERFVDARRRGGVHAQVA